MRHGAIALVRLYQLTLGQLIGGRCKYHPSCSQYAIDAYEHYGLVRGTLKSGSRLLRCNPWSHGGLDYVDSGSREAPAEHATTEPAS